MKVKDLIVHLQAQDQEMLVAYCFCSDQKLMHVEEISIIEAGEPRNDDYIHAKRFDKPSQKYLLFPGN